MTIVKTASPNLPLPSREQAPPSKPGPTELEAECSTTGEDTDVRWEMLPCTD